MYLFKGVYCLKELRNLSLNNNSIESIGEKISELNMLVSLDISNNQITSLHSNIGFLTQERRILLH